MLIKELVYIVLDLCKLSGSDDAFITEDHALALLKAHRKLLIKQDELKNPESGEEEYQQICLDLQVDNTNKGLCQMGNYLKSVQKMPKIVSGTTPRVYPVNYFLGTNVSYISRDRMKYVGTNRYLQNFIYAALGPDDHLYLNSGNPQIQYMQKIRVSAVFDEPDAIIDLLCNDDGVAVPCDIMDMEFPIRGYLIPALIDSVAKELLGAAYRPKDSYNSASDDLAELINFIRRNTKTPLQKDIEGE